MGNTVPYWPFYVLFIGIAAVILQIVVFRIHAFIALVLSAILVGMLSASSGAELVRAIELTMEAMGTVAGKIAFVIALASILGVALTESGGAERIVVKFVSIFGERLAPLALLLAGFVLAIPVFFDTVFFLIIPIAHSMGRRFGKNYLFFVMAIAIGGVLTHSLVPPTPGPLAMAEALTLDLSAAILLGIAACILPAAVAYVVVGRLCGRFNIAVPHMEGVDEPAESDLPPFSLSMMPIIVPLLLIMAASLPKLFPGGEDLGLLGVVLAFFGNKNIAMLIGTAIALWLLARQKRWGLKALSAQMEKPLELAGLIILITSAGGAFGTMIKNSGIDVMMQDMVGQGVAINFVLLAWTIASVLKIAQGSGTVAIIVTSGIMSALTKSVELPYHIVYIYMAIGYGSLMISWMNDSAFWVVSKLGGFTTKETFYTWTATLAILSALGLIQALVFSTVLPMV